MTPEQLKTHIHNHRAAFNINKGSEFSIEIHAPWAATYTGRIQYWVRMAGKEAPHIIVKAASPLWGGCSVLNTPSVTLPHMPLLGEFELGGYIYTWSEFIEGVSLFSELNRHQSKRVPLSKDAHPPRIPQSAWDQLNMVADQLAQLQQADMALVRFTVDDLQSIIIPRIPCADARKKFSLLCKQYLKTLSTVETLASWSHGDLWSQDIIVHCSSFTVIDWEWFTRRAPFGVDLIDLYITTAIFHLMLPIREAMNGLLSDAIPHLSFIRKLILSQHKKEKDISFLMIYALLRYIGRYIAQYNTIDNDAIASIIKLTKKRYNIP